MGNRLSSCVQVLIKVCLEMCSLIIAFNSLFNRWGCISQIHFQERDVPSILSVGKKKYIALANNHLPIIFPLNSSLENSKCTDPVSNPVPPAPNPTRKIKVRTTMVVALCRYSLHSSHNLPHCLKPI